jgi:N-acetylmuramic acid 6-phosphate etherase
MISTTAMIQMGRVKGNKMVDMQLSNNKLVDRATRMLMTELNIAEDEAQFLIDKYKSVRMAINSYKNG